VCTEDPALQIFVEALDSPRRKCIFSDSDILDSPAHRWSIHVQAGEGPGEEKLKTLFINTVATISMKQY
jgi:hypothetical protein